MGHTNQPEDLGTRLRALEQQVKDLRRATLASAVISSGSLEVRDPTDGHVIIRVGVHDYGGGPVPGFAIFRTDGSTAFWAFDTSSGDGGYVAIYDDQQNEVVRPDTIAGQGLATPWLSHHVTPWSRVLTPPETTTSGTFTTLWRSHLTKQHAQFRVRLVAKCAADTSGEVRLAVGGTQVSSTLGLPVANYQYHDIYATVDGFHLSDVSLDVDARRTAGTGTVGIEVVDVQGLGL